MGFVTVTGVSVTPDLRLARVFYTAMGDDRARRATAAALRSARGHLRQVIGHEVRMKVLPDLRFEEDAAIEQGDRIEELLRELQERGRTREPRPDGKAAAALSEATSVAIACHVNPDADALGSMLGLSNHLRGMGKETVCSFGNDPFEAPRWAGSCPASTRSCRRPGSRRSRP